MAIKPEDKPKLIGLVVALLGVVAYVLIFLVPRITATATPAPKVDPPPPLAAASATAPAGAPAVQGEASAALPDEDTAPIPAPPGRDSFTPPPASSHAPTPVNPMASAKLPNAPSVAVPGSPAGPGIAPALIVGPPVPPPLPPIELKGVILGDPAVAVISVNGEVVQRQVGEVITGSLKLAKIAEAGITVFDGKHWVPVTVGHMMAGTGPMANTTAVPAAAATSTAPAR